MTTFVKTELKRLIANHPFVVILVRHTARGPIWSWYGDSTLERLTERISDRLEAGWRAAFFDRDELNLENVESCP